MNLSLEQLAGQRLMIGFEGLELSDRLRFMIRDLKIGGVVLFAGNLQSPAQIRELCHAVQEYARSCGQPPLLIAIDQEGGEVARLKAPFTQFSGNPFMAGVDDALRFAEITAAELTAVGINMDLAPVLDVAPKAVESIMAGRAFGADPGWVAELGNAVIEGLQQRGIMAVAKHFPGIGRTVLDSHLHLPTLPAKLTEMENSDFLPFQAAITRKVSGIMLSHVLYERIDPNWPASLSEIIARDLLRGRMGYDGVVMTDDLDMGAVAPHYTLPVMVERFLAADIDLCLICHESDKIDTAFELILRSLREDDGLRSRAETCADRILKIKREYLLEG